MKRLIVALIASAVGMSAHALPKLGYYKTQYSADHGGFSCMQITSNTKKVVVLGRGVIYFEMGPVGGPKLTCIPQVFLDTDDAATDGDAAKLMFTSLSTAACSASDGTPSTEVSFDGSHVFWGGESFGPVTLPDRAIPAIAMVKERQTSISTFYSSTVCP